VKCAQLPVSARFHGLSYRLGLALLSSALDECVAAVFKFGRSDRLHGREARTKPKFSVDVAATSVATAAEAAVAAVTVTVIARVVAVGAVKGTGA
jgi:hypothetical protein